MKSFVYHPLFMVFTVLYWWSLPSLFIEINIYYTYIPYIWSLPCYIKSFNLSMSIKSKQWFSVIEFLQKWRQVSTKKCLKVKFLPKISHNFFYQTFSKKKVFHQQILKRNLRKKITEEKSLPNKIQIEISANKYLTIHFFIKIIEREISTK